MSTPRLPEVELGTEDSCLLACSRRRLDPSLVEFVREALCAHAATFDWGRFLDQASRHRVIGMVAANLQRHDLMMTDIDAIPVIPSQHRWLLRAAYLANRARGLAMIDEIRLVAAALAQADVRAVVRKGGYLTRAMYGDPGVRRMGDLDLLVESGAQLQEVRRCLSELGYAQGTVSRNGRSVSPVSRRSELHWTLNLSSLPPFVRTTSDPYVDQFYVDVRTGLVGASSGVDVPTADILSQAATFDLDGQPMLVPSVEHGLIDLCLHLFREATSIYYIEAGKDLTVMKFCDVAEYVGWTAGRLDQERFLHDVRRYSAERQVFFALHFTDVLYPGAVPRSLLDAFAPGSMEFLDEYGTEERQPNRWRTDFLTRLFDAGRAYSHGGRSTVPLEPRT